MEKKQKITMEEAGIRWLEERRYFWKPGTYAVYRRIAEKYIFPHLGKMPAEEIDQRTVLELYRTINRDGRGKRLAASYQNLIFSVLIRVLRYTQKMNHFDMEIPHNPVSVRSRSLTLPGERDMEILRTYLIAHADDSTCLGILLTYYTGIRIGELCALQWKDIDLKNEMLHITKTLQRISRETERRSGVEILPPKTAHSMRDIPIPASIQPYLRKYQESGDNYVVKGLRCAWAECRTMQYRFAGILKKCAVQPFNFHILRHAFATRCIEKGFDMKSLSELLGHSSVQITMGLYVHSSFQHKRKLMQLLD